MFRSILSRKGNVIYSVCRIAAIISEHIQADMMIIQKWECKAIEDHCINLEICSIEHNVYPGGK